MYVYPTQFFPGTPSAAQATTLTLKSGQERGSVDFTLRPAKATRVSGNVLGPDGPVASVAPRLVPEGDDFATELETSATMSGASGEFTFLGLLPGQYSLLAAVDDVEPGEWFDPAFLQRLEPAATKISVAEGEKKVMDLRGGGG